MSNQTKASLTAITFGAMATLSTQHVNAVDLPQAAEIFLIDRQQQQVKIGDVTFADADNAESTTGIAVTMDYSAFNDHFLSMRPFKCIEGESEWFCHLPYPYDTRALISETDLTDLEYQLLFIRKTPTEFGIDAWNGLYYQLTLNEDGSMTGDLLEGDLNVLASPPEEPYARPIDLNEFIEAEASRRLFPGLIIKATTP